MEVKKEDFSDFQVPCRENDGITRLLDWIVLAISLSL